MKWVALVTWLITVLTGAVLFNAWLAAGGMEQARQGGRRVRPWLILSHIGLATIGLLIWVVYVMIDDQGLNWLAFIVLLPTALLGLWMFSIWLLRRRAESAGAAAVGDSPPEQRFPVPLVVVHGLFAIVTVILVLIESAAGESEDAAGFVQLLV
jgi:hypothetical protein